MVRLVWWEKSRVKIKVKKGDSTAVAARCTAKRKAAVMAPLNGCDVFLWTMGFEEKFTILYDLRFSSDTQNVEERSRPLSAHLVVSVLIRPLTRRSRGRVSQSGFAIDLQTTIARILRFHDCNRSLKTRHVDASNRDSANEPRAGDFLKQ